MKIIELTIENYKGFAGKHILKFDKNFMFFVGENNTGKSTVFEAIEFVKSGLPDKKTVSDIRNKNATDSVTVTIKFQENIKSVINDFSESKYEKFVFDEDGMETLIARRSSEELTIKQSGKDVIINIKKITLWNSETSQFENPSGIDTVFKTLFEAQFIWADTNPNDIADFGSTKICGRLLNGAVGNFFESEQWKKFTDTHQETFHGAGDSLSVRAKKVEEDIQRIMTNQYGDAKVKFDFSLPETSNFIKSGKINIDDGADTSFEEKGTGMQRALALSLIQVYAETLTKHPEDPEKTKPLFLFIDEPETFLHPKAQQQLLKALEIISNIRQVFICTHSPYLLKSFDSTKHSLNIFSKDSSAIKISPSGNLNLFKWSPSWGEINYKAYGLCTIEFHNELYGHIQEKENKFKQEDVELFFESKSFTKNKDWIKIKNGTAQPLIKVTLMTFIRNTIHHPENRTNLNFTDAELKQSIENMLALA